MEEAAFLKAIEAAPDDYAPRGIYADWLDEHGRPIEAELHRQWKPLEGNAANVSYRGTIAELRGKTLADVQVFQEHSRGHEIEFVCTDGDRFRMYHSQDCCESVVINDIVGDVKDLIGNPILMAEEATSAVSPEGCPTDSESQTWTFYRLATVRGYVTIRWWGTSNGYYSETADFERIAA